MSNPIPGDDAKKRCDLELFKQWKGYDLPALNSDGNFDKDWLHREFVAFRAGLARFFAPVTADVAADSIAPTAPHGTLLPDGDEFVRLMSAWRMADVGCQSRAAFDAVVSHINAWGARRAAGAPAETVKAVGEPVPQGWEVSHPEPWDAMTDQAQCETRISVKRLSRPFCDKDNIRIWSGPTLEDAMGKACLALDLPLATPSPSAEVARDAARYRWLCDNNFDRQVTQIQTWVHTWESHSQTGEPTEWKARVRGGALDRVIDAAMKLQAPAKDS